MKPRESTLPLRAFTTEWTAFCSEGVISKCAAKMLSLVGRVEPIEGVVVPDPRAELGAIVARVTCEPRPVTIGGVESGKAPSGEFSFAGWDIVAAVVVGRTRRGRRIVDPCYLPSGISNSRFVPSRFRHEQIKHYRNGSHRMGLLQLTSVLNS